MNDDWQAEFRRVWDRGMVAWEDGRRTPGKMFDDKDAAFLATIGCTRQELFDFVDDLNRYGEPDLETALEVAVLRRDYFVEVLRGRSSGWRASMDELPAKTDRVDGIAWLPRLIVKARLKLRGEMPDDLMYGCGGDRGFLAESGMTLADFLRLVWEAGTDDRRVVETVKAARGAGSGAPRPMA